MNDIGAQIKAARKQAGLSQEELAEKIGCQQKQISNWERGSFIPKFSTIVKIADVTNKTLEFFADREKL